VSPTYYYHYSGFMAPFVALIGSSLVARYRIPVCTNSLSHSRLLPLVLAAVALPSAVALMLGASVDDIVTLPAAPQVGDVVSDAIPPRGCVLYANPTLALLDDRFTSDVSGCPDVIDWLGQERVLDNGQSVARSDADDRHLQVLISRWIESSDAVVLEQSNLGLDSANVTYLTSHFAREINIPRGLRIYVRSRPAGARATASPSSRGHRSPTPRR